METYSIRISSHRTPEVWRVIELRANHSLRDLHAVIAEEFGLSDAPAWRFFLSNRPWERAGAYSDETPGTRLGSLGLHEGSRFLHVALDGEQAWHRCEVVSVGTAERTQNAPRVLERQGEPPDPFARLDFLFGGDEDEETSEPTELDDEARALGDEAARAANEHDAHFEREDAVDAPRPREVVLRDLALAQRLVARFGEQPEQFDALVADLDAPVLDWLELLPFDLEDHGLLDEAIALCDALAPLLAPADLAVARATLLQEAGRTGEALEQAERALDSFPDDPNVRVRTARVFHRAGEATRAEDLCRSVLEADLAGEEAGLYADAIEILGEILRASGREAEAEALEHSEQAARAEGADESEEGASLLDLLLPPDETPAVRTQAPKVGRNDPCPCGSGEKYRLCHGR
jgi:tetratricopeptide (TPR) repeat protein